jgi:hypothetical protein
MKDEAKKRLKRILSAYDEKLAETERLEAASRAAKAAFPERFSALKKEMLLPVLGELAELLTASGHEATATEQEESSSSASGVASAAISLRVTPKSVTQKAADTKKGFIEVTFSANRRERNIVVSSTTTIINSGASIGKRGEYEIEILTADIVVDHVLQTLEKAFAGE